MSGKIAARLKKKAGELKREITAVYYAYKTPGLPFLPKLVILITLGYALSPIDLIPDFIPVLGYLDDLLIIPGLLALSIRLIPEDIMEQARIKAEEKPLRLSKNPAAAVIIILIWAAVIFIIIRQVLK
ncbi:MAG: DUF1232 domain-containing protein [Spirochaetales bacterium]|nr:DUF1232 domain-containing protein [Spirochaetales bacterium]